MIGEAIMISRRPLACVAAFVAALGVLLSGGVASAGAAEGTPKWAIEVLPSPTNLIPEAGFFEDWLTVVAINVGSGPTTAGATITDILPEGLAALYVEGEDQFKEFTAYAELSCKSTPEPSCTDSHPLDPGDMVVMRIYPSVNAGLPAQVMNAVTAEGGGSPTAKVETSLAIGGAVSGYGLVPGTTLTALSTMQAGAHPNVTTAFSLTTRELNEQQSTSRDVRFDMPVGLVGNTRDIPRCTMHGVVTNTCPSSALVGVAHVMVNRNGVALYFPAAVFNIVPAPGEPAAFAFDISGFTNVRLDTSVLSNGNDGVRVSANLLSELEPTLGAVVTIWGVPAEHNGPGLDEISTTHVPFGGPSDNPRVPLLTNPQQCTSPLSAAMTTDSWEEPGRFITAEPMPLGVFEGCNQLRFSSKFSMVPDTLEAGAPAGYHFDLEVPQNEAAGGLATPNVKDVKLTLPKGTVVNPSAAWGLKACSALDFYGPNHPSQEPAQKANCPRESQVGQVSVKTPALEEALEGQVFLAEPECHPCTPEDAADGRMVRLYVQAVSEGAGGIVVKLEGKGMIDQETGQITAVFDENPQLPFSEFELKLSGGPRAVLVNPRTCGGVSSSLDLTPWSTPETPDFTGNYGFEISQNCHGPEFHPSFVVGMPNVEAGEYGEFTLAFGRPDNSEFLKSLSIHTPPGLMGSLAGVPLCKEADASAGTCPEASLLGTAEVLTGPGADPFLVSGGKVYLTESYGGAPFGLSIVVPAVAGPYTLSGTAGHGTVVVRAQIFVDPRTAQLTVTSGEMPSVLDGIPLQLQAVNVRIDRPHFMFNPTSCNKMAITGTLDAVEGMSAGVESPFQVTNCARLAFKPQFSASTSGSTSRTEGASLKVNLAYPNAPFGSQANIHSVRVELPGALPSRLTTLNHACPAATFEANPAVCPAASRVGFAKATTPILPVAVEGPAYFVSNGAQKFPELILVLQGYGVTIELHGETFISKAGITSSTFNTVPDVPVSSFELSLPEGQFSALAANGKLCNESLVMPTAFTAQNGATLNQDTPVEVEGCPNALRLVSHKVHKRGLTLKVAVPQAGKLVASGNGVSTVRKTAKGRMTLTLKLKARRSGRLRTRIVLRFSPAAGRQREVLEKSIGVTFD